MLTRLAISNLATIQSLSIEFDSGFSVLTGETGAGKSILIDALRLVMGAKGSPDMVRAGTDAVTVEASFDIANQPDVLGLLDELDIPTEGELVLRRSIQATGRSRILANDRQLSAARLTELARYLINIHGQHDNQMLLDTKTHLLFLDGYARLGPARDKFGMLFHEYGALLRKRDDLRGQSELQEQSLAELRERIEDIRAGNLSASEDTDLRREHAMLTHAEQLQHLMGQLCGGLHDDEDAILTRLAAAAGQLNEAAGFDERLKPFHEQLRPVQIQLEELYRSLRTYTAGLEGDPNRLEAVNARMAEIERLTRRYGGSVDAVLEELAQSEKELADTEQADTRLEALESSVAKLAGRLHREAQTLSDQRGAVAQGMAEQIEIQLRELGMEKVTFQVDIVEQAGPNGKRPFYTPAGMDRVEFLISTNPGQPPRALSKIASGGELSRSMLALKSILAESDPTAVLVFDEIDAGISGATAEITGRKLRALGQTHQVLCVTHLPQIAAQGNHHFRVAKSSRDNQTYTVVEPLRGDQQVQEIARLISGVEVSDKALASAEELVSQAQQSTP